MASPRTERWRRMFSAAAVSWALELMRSRRSASACATAAPRLIWLRPLLALADELHVGSQRRLSPLVVHGAGV